MSYGIKECSNCGGEVKVYEGHGGKCPNCGYWISCSYFDDDIDYEKEEEDKIQKEIDEAVAKGTLKVRVDCREDDDDRSWYWHAIFDTFEEAIEWEKKNGCQSEFSYWDGDRRII